MREIKFRGKRKDTQGWVIGFLDYNPIECIFLIHEVGDIPPTWNEPGGDIYSKRFEIIPETIGQFTGLKDKNRKDIYEGDIIKFHYWSTYEQRSFPEYVDFRDTDLKEGTGIVYWNTEELSWYGKPSEYCRSYKGSETLSPVEEMPLVYMGATKEAISEWLADVDNDDEVLKYQGCEGLAIIGNIYDTPELLTPAEGAVNYNMNNNLDPKEGEVKEANATTAEPVNIEGDNAGEATPVDSEEGSTEG